MVSEERVTLCLRSHDLTRVRRARSIEQLCPLQLTSMYKSSKQGTKRKSQDSLPDSRSAKQPKLTIDAFFSPKVSVRVGSGLNGVNGDAEDKVLDVVLSEEQVRVMRMVVDDGKNIFFTGSAGTLLCNFLGIFFPFSRVIVLIVMPLLLQVPGSLCF